MLGRLIVSVMLLAGAGICMASTPLFEPDDRPRGETVLEPIRYSVPPIPPDGMFSLIAEPLDKNRVLLSGAIGDFSTTPPTATILPFIVVDLNDNTTLFLGPLDSFITALSVNGTTCAVPTVAETPDGWRTKLWIIDLETWQAVEVSASTILQNREITDVSFSPDGRQLLVSFIDPMSQFSQHGAIYNTVTGEVTSLGSISNLSDSFKWTPDSKALIRSRSPDTTGFASTSIDRVGLDGEVIEELGYYFNQRFVFQESSPNANYALLSPRPAIVDLSKGTIIDIADARARSGRRGHWSLTDDKFLICSGRTHPLEPEPNHVFEIGLDGQTLRHWEFGDHQISTVFWTPGRDDPYAVTTRGEIYLLHGEDGSTFRRRVWSIHRSPLRNP